MAEEFDPVWEYYEGDPEIIELIAQAGGFRRVMLDDLRLEPSFRVTTQRGIDRPLLWQDDVWYDLKCVSCNREFRSLREDQRYCNRACRSLRPIQCGKCGKTFTPSSSTRRYCSRACWRLARTTRPPKRPRVVRGETKCLECLTVFIPRWPCQTMCRPVCARARQARRNTATVTAIRVTAPPPEGISLAAAKLEIANGKQFVKVYRLVTLEDRPAFKEWYVRTPFIQQRTDSCTSTPAT